MLQGLLVIILLGLTLLKRLSCQLISLGTWLLVPIRLITSQCTISERQGNVYLTGIIYVDVDQVGSLGALYGPQATNALDIALWHGSTILEVVLRTWSDHGLARIVRMYRLDLFTLLDNLLGFVMTSICNLINGCGVWHDLEIRLAVRCGWDLVYSGVDVIRLLCLVRLQAPLTVLTSSSNEVE